MNFKTGYSIDFIKFWEKQQKIFEKCIKKTAASLNMIRLKTSITSNSETRSQNVFSSISKKIMIIFTYIEGEKESNFQNSAPFFPFSAIFVLETFQFKFEGSVARLRLRNMR